MSSSNCTDVYLSHVSLLKGVYVYKTFKDLLCVIVNYSSSVFLLPVPPPIIFTYSE